MAAEVVLGLKVGCIIPKAASIKILFTLGILMTSPSSSLSLRWFYAHELGDFEISTAEIPVSGDIYNYVLVNSEL